MLQTAQETSTITLAALQEHEARIAAGLNAALSSFRAIKNGELYRAAGLDSFPEYLRQRYGKTYAYKVIAALSGVEGLSDPFAVANISQAAALSKVDPDWRGPLLEAMNQDPDGVTASKIAGAWEALKDLPEPVRGGVLSILNRIPGKLTRTAIKETADAILEVAVTGALEYADGQQVTLEQLASGLEPGLVNMAYERMQRQREYLRPASHKAPPLVFEGRARPTLQTIDIYAALGIAPDEDVLISIRQHADGGGSLTIHPKKPV